MVKHIKFLLVTVLFSSPFTYAAEHVTEEYVRECVVYINSSYNPMLERLKSDEAVRRSEILSLYERDPSLRREDAGGHDQFKHRDFPTVFGVVGRKDMQLPPGERKSAISTFQIYVNVIRYIVQYDIGADRGGAFNWTEAFERYQKVRETPGYFKTLMDTETKNYEEYSRKK